MNVRQVNATSLPVTGTPSLQTAFCLIFMRSVKGFRLTTCPSPSAMSGTAEKFGLRMYRPRVAVPAVHDVQVLLHPASAVFRHGGSCSAAKTTVPPCLGFCDVPAEPPAAKTIATSPTTAMAVNVNRRINVPLLSNATGPLPVKSDR